MARPTDQEAAEHAERAVQLRIQGKSYRAIAREMGLSKSAVEKAVMKALGAYTPEPPEQLRTLEAERLDDLLDRLHTLLESSDQPLFVMDRMLKVAAQRAQLLGINKPVIVEDDLGDQLAATLKRVAQRYKAIGDEPAESDASAQDA